MREREEKAWKALLLPPPRPRPRTPLQQQQTIQRARFGQLSSASTATAAAAVGRGVVWRTAPNGEAVVVAAATAAAKAKAIQIRRLDFLLCLLLCSTVVDGHRSGRTLSVLDTAAEKEHMCQCQCWKRIIED